MENIHTYHRDNILYGNIMITLIIWINIDNQVSSVYTRNIWEYTFLHRIYLETVIGELISAKKNLHMITLYEIKRPTNQLKNQLL